MSTTSISSAFPDRQYDELGAWLGRRRKGIQDIVELEGFLTAIVIGPDLVPPHEWLPKVWGGKKSGFKTAAELNRFITLVVGLYNELALIFDRTPQRFRPTFYESRVHGETIRIVDGWCMGFLKGMRLTAREWKPLERDRPDLLKPLKLFGSQAGWHEMEAGDGEKLHRRWSPKIAPAVKAIHAYWLPHRIAQQRRLSNSTLH